MLLLRLIDIRIVNEDALFGTVLLISWFGSAAGAALTPKLTMKWFLFGAVGHPDPPKPSLIFTRIKSAI